MLRRRRVPADALVRVAAGDRVVAWARAGDGDVVLATTRGLLLPGPGEMAWQDIEKAVWSAPHLTITVLPEGPAVVSGTGPSYRLELTDPGDLPAVIRARVTASVAWSSHSRLPRGGGVRVVGRRHEDRELLDWQLVFDQGTDPADPVVRAQAEQLLDAARRTIG